jgi:CHRD domain
MTSTFLRSTFLRSTFAAAACTIAIACAGPATAATVNLKADLKSADEVPPNPSAGSGSVTATFDTDSKMLTWKGTYSGLTGPATAAHFHGPAEPGKNAGVVVPVFTAATAKSPFEGSMALDDAKAADLLAGKLYFNVHTETNKGGEIRGQVIK